MRLSRRQIITGGQREEWQVASMVIQCLPEKLAATCAALSAIDAVSIPENDSRGKMVALIEARGESALMEAISNIESTAGVISANLVYHQIDPDT